MIAISIPEITDADNEISPLYGPGNVKIRTNNDLVIGKFDKTI